MRHLILSLSLILGLATSVSAELPKAGSCETQADDYYPKTSVIWASGQATVKKVYVNETFQFPSDKFIIRPHSEFWKISIFYTETPENSFYKKYSLNEVVIFEFKYPEADKSRYRLGEVSYYEAQDGTRVIDSIQGFEEANCSLF